MMLYVARCKRAGFTLIEIMIVIAIIAILAGIAIPNIQQARAEAMLAGCRQNIMNIVKAIELATVRCSYSDLVRKAYNGTSSSAYSVNQTTGLTDYLLENGYLGSLPKCPAASAPYGSTGSYYVYTVQSESGTALHGGMVVTCYTKAGSKYGHAVGIKAIRPVYLISQKKVVINGACADGVGGSGWCDYIYDL